MIRNNFRFQKTGLFLVTFSILLSVFITGCKEDVLDVGIELLPEDELLNAEFDTLNVDAYTVAGAPVHTYLKTAAPLGYYKDDVFGEVKCNILMNYMWTGSFSMPDTFEILDIELKLGYTDSLGYIDDVQFDVYEYTDEFPPDSVLSDYEVTPSMISSSLRDGNFVIDSTYITVPLQKSFGEKLFDSTLWDPGETAYESDSLILFWKYYEGLYLEAEETAGSGALAYISFAVDSSFLQLRYVKNNEDTLLLKYVISKTHNLYELDYTGSENDNPGNMMQKENVFLQTLGGTNVLVQIPGLDVFRDMDEKISVNKAELVFRVDSNLVDRNLLSRRLALKYMDIDDNQVPLKDYQLGFASSYFGGIIDTVAWECKFNISNWVQDYILEKSETYNEPRLIMHLAVYVDSDSGYRVYRMDYVTVAYRAVPLFSGVSDSPPELRLIYSVIDSN